METTKFPVTIIDAREMEKGHNISRTLDLTQEQFEDLCDRTRQELMSSFPWECYPGQEDKVILAVAKKIDLLSIHSANVYCQGYLVPDSRLSELEKNYSIIFVKD